jgi:hypothetical protein
MKKELHVEEETQNLIEELPQHPFELMRNLTFCISSIRNPKTTLYRLLKGGQI